MFINKNQNKNKNKFLTTTNMLFSSVVIGSALMLSSNVIAVDNASPAVSANTNAEVNANVRAEANAAVKAQENAEAKAKATATNNNEVNNPTRNSINFLSFADPTRPPNAPAVRNDKEGNVVSIGPTLQGIFQKNNVRMAVINSKYYFVGNQVNLSGEDLKVSKINENNVVLTGGSAGEIVLSLTPSVNKENVSGGKSKVGKTKKSNKK